MRKNAGIGLLASSVFCGLAVAVVPVAVNHLDGSTSSGPDAAAAVAVQQDEGRDDQELDEAELDDETRDGPPAWAHANGKGKTRGADKSWKEAWRQLTPAQKAAKMTALAQAHEQGMQEWTACVAAAGDDTTARAKCAKPLPPGLAKKLP